jgi:CheY-like chemotaxis protein
VPEFSPSPPPNHPASGAGTALPPVRLKVLHLEDNEGDHALVTAHLRRGGIEADITRVETEAALIEALADDWDLILSDYNLPGYSGLAALDKVRSLGKLVPFILVSGQRLPAQKQPHPPGPGRPAGHRGQPHAHRQAARRPRPDPLAPATA